MNILILSKSAFCPSGKIGEI